MARDTMRKASKGFLDPEEEAARAAEIESSLGEQSALLAEEAALVGPPDLRSAERALSDEIAAEQRARWEAMTPEERRIRTTARELRSSPAFAATMRALDVPLLGFADELGGLGLAMSDEDFDYRTGQRATEQAIAEASEENPRAAALGSLLGMGVAAGMNPIGTARGAPGAQAFRFGGTGAAAGAGIGAVGGALGASEGDRLSGAARGALIGAGLGGAGGALVGAGRGLSTAATYAPRTIGGALEGAGYGLLATPASTRTPIGEMDLETAREAAINAGVGGAIGGGLGLVLNPLALNRQRAAETVSILPGQPRVSSGRATGAVDEALLDVYDVDALQTIDDGDPLVDDGLFGPEPQQIAADIRTEQERVPWYQRIFRDALRVDPNVARLNSMGVLDQRDLRRMERAFGSARGAVEALNEAGLALPGTTYATRDARAQAQAVADSLRADLANVHRHIAEAGNAIDPSVIADDIEAIAARYETGYQGPNRVALIRALRDRADDFRYGTGQRPTTQVEALAELETLPSLAGEATVETGRTMAPVTELPMPPELTYPTLRDELTAQAERNRRIYSGMQTTPPTASDEAGLDVYRAMARARDREAERVLGPEAFAEYQRRQRAFQAAQNVAESRFETRGPAMMRAGLGGIAEASGQGGISGLVGRVFGFGREQAIAAWQPSVLAALNETGGASREQIVSAAARLVLDSGAPLDDAARATLDAASRGQRVPEDAIAAAIEQARGAGGSAGTQAARAASLVRGADQWPPILRGIARIAQTDPARAQRLGALAEAAASRGTLATVLPLVEGDIPLVRSGPRTMAAAEGARQERVLSASDIAPEIDEELTPTPLFGGPDSGEDEDEEITPSPLFGADAPRRSR